MQDYVQYCWLPAAEYMIVVRRVANQVNNLAQRALKIVFGTREIHDEPGYALFRLLAESQSTIY